MYDGRDKPNLGPVTNQHNALDAVPTQQIIEMGVPRRTESKRWIKNNIYSFTPYWMNRAEFTGGSNS